MIIKTKNILQTGSQTGICRTVGCTKAPLVKGGRIAFLGDPGGFVQAVRIRRNPCRITVLRRAESLRVAFSRRPTSAQGISSTNQIENLGSHLPLTREALGEADSSINIYLTVVPRAGCILPLRLLWVVRWVSARPVVAPYGCSKQTDKLLFDFISILSAQAIPQ